MMYRLLDECNIMNPGCVAIFRVHFDFERGFKYFKRKIKIKPELLFERPHLKLKQILISNYHYDLLDKRLIKYKE